MSELREKTLEVINELKKHWGLEHISIDRLDPIVLLMVGACAWEADRIGKFIHETNARIIDKLIDSFLHFKYSLPTPAHALAECIPGDRQYRVTPENSFFINTTGGNIYFKPVMDAHILNARIAFSVRGQRFGKHTKAGIESQNLGLTNDVFSSHNIILGLQVDRTLPSLENLNFALVFNNNTLAGAPEISEAFRQTKFLSGIKVFVNEREVSYKKVISEDGSVSDHSKTNGYYSPLDEVKREICSHYASNIFKIAQEVQPESIPLPAQYVEKYKGTPVTNVKEKLVWLRIELPSPMPSALMESLDIAVNCVPVANYRKINTFLDKFYSARILETKENEYFLNVSDFLVFDELNHLDLKDRYNQHPPFVVRDFGLSNLNDFEVMELLSEVYEKFKTDHFALKAISGIDYVTIDNLTDVLQLMRYNTTKKQKNKNNKDTWIVLHHDVLKEKELLDRIKVTVNYQVTNGAIANNITNLQLTSEKSDIQSARLVNRPAGGKNPPQPHEKKSAIRFALMSPDQSYDKILTNEDVKAYCQYLLGNNLLKIEVCNSVGLARQKGGGITRCTRVDITLSSEADFNSKDLAVLEQTLEEKLEFRSDRVLPYMVKIGSV